MTGEAREHPRPPAVALDSVSRSFAAVRALDRVSLSFARGKVHGLIGENGAGKSTMMNIMSGVLRPDRGRVLVNGAPVVLRRPADAQRLGVTMIHQELNLVEDLDVADNIFLGREPVRGGLIDRRGARREAKKMLDSIGCDASPAAGVKHLSIAQKQMVEIAKALSQETSVLIMDEPTAVLTRREVSLLMELIRRLRQRGVTVIYISHILPEVQEICDRITVLRDGRVVKTLDHDGERSEHELANLMVGREISRQFPPRHAPGGRTALRVESLSVPGWVEQASFEVRQGEMLGFAGLIGAGRTQLGEAIAGLRRKSGGRVVLDGEPAGSPAPKRPIDALRRGIAYVSEDRQGRGLVMSMSVMHNLTLASLERHARGLINGRTERDAALQRVRELGVRIGRPEDPIDTLSGGNQQKVSLAKWLETRPKVLILDEPTRGVDVGAKAEIYRLIHQLAARGMACIVISSEMTELLGLCHRIAVMRDGRIEAMLDGPQATEQQVMYHAAGVTAGEEKQATQEC